MNGQLELFSIPPTDPGALRPEATVHWAGETRIGVARCGLLEPGESVEAFARARYRGRWRSLEVTIAGQVVATITGDPDQPGRRHLWIKGICGHG